MQENENDHTHTHTQSASVPNSLHPKANSLGLQTPDQWSSNYRELQEQTNLPALKRETLKPKPRPHPACQKSLKPKP